MSYLEKIVSEKSKKPPVVCIYGEGGIGKTTFAMSGEKALLLPTEEGWGKLEVDRLPLVKTFDDYRESIAELKSGDHDYRILTIDSLDWLEPLIWKEVLKTNKPNPEKIEDYGYGKGYMFAADIWRSVLDDLKSLRDERNMAIVTIAHQEVKPFHDPTSEPYDRYQIKLQNLARALVFEWADAVLFCGRDVKTKRAERGSQPVRGISTGKRILFCEARPAFEAKNRFGLPAEIDMNWETLVSAIKGDYKNGNVQQSTN